MRSFCDRHIKKLRQIIDLLVTDKTRYIAQPGPIIVLSFDHSLFFNELGSSGNEAICHFSRKSDRNKEKKDFVYT